MLHDYGCDDIDWLEAHGPRPGVVQVERDGQFYPLPLARFDNRTDKTSFLRQDSAAWGSEDVERLHQELAGALHRLSLGRQPV